MYKKLIIRLIFGFFLFVVLDRIIFMLTAFPTENLASSIMLKPCLYYPPKTDMIAIGASHMQTGLNPEVFKEETGFSIFNASAMARGFVSTYYIFRELYAKIKKPRLVIMDIPWEGLDRNNSFSGLGPFDFNYLSRRNKLDYLWRYKPSDVKLFFKTYAFRRYSLFHSSLKSEEDFKASVLAKFGEIDSLGYCAPPMSLNDSLAARELDRIQRRFDFKGKLVIEYDKLRGIKDILRFCKKNDIKIVIVETPECNIWREKQHREEYTVFMQSLVDEFGVTYISFNTPDNPIIGDVSNFVDMDHLNAKGARLWTKQLSKELKKRGII